MIGMGDLKKKDDELQREQERAAALGEILYKEHYTNPKGMELPEVNPSSVSLAYPRGLSDTEKRQLDAYFLKKKLGVLDKQNKQGE